MTDPHINPHYQITQGPGNWPPPAPQPERKPPMSKVTKFLLWTFGLSVGGLALLAIIGLAVGPEEVEAGPTSSVAPSDDLVVEPSTTTTEASTTTTEAVTTTTAETTTTTVAESAVDLDDDVLEALALRLLLEPLATGVDLDDVDDETLLVAADGVCTIAEAADGDQDLLTLGLLTLWGDDGGSAESIFETLENFAEGAGVMIGARCPEHLP